MSHKTCETILLSFSTSFLKEVESDLSTSTKILRINTHELILFVIKNKTKQKTPKMSPVLKFQRH